ncbi:MAG: hypothetical protein ABIN89_20005 [Chitinophagaceae bacterium]
MSKGKIIFRLLVSSFIMFNFISCFKNDTREPPPVVNTCTGITGPLFAAVKNLVATKCVGCHNNVIANGGMNFTIECNIVINKSIIKRKAVDEGTMPPTGTLPQADKATISNWINAGGKYTD